MDYPKSVPNVGLVNGKFVDENSATGQVGSLIPSTWGNAVTNELLNVIESAGLQPDELNDAQLLGAIQELISSKIPESPGQATENSAGVAKVATSLQLAEGADDSAFITAKKVVPYIRDAIKNSVVKATESVAGVAKVATHELVSEGSDDSAFVTSLKLVPLKNRVSVLESRQGFTKYAVTPEQVITEGGSLTIAHGLGTWPVLWEAYLVCKEAEHGYWPGAVLSIASSAPDNAYHLGVTLVPDQNNLNCKYGTQTGVFFVLDWNTRTTRIITPSKWRVFFKVWA
ncbi:hypothetical protein NJH78_25630 [Pseudomonas chlororaphis]|uniref:hypothetical protein n=1 Tax=Pseudomonas chlororaphis TaxID=587753 RepID=UPI00209B870B|nr:hypothetical protein [Pseudomonas chlororaphis]MCO7573374.1 hypothetical protein [Pseudomonas chlororaphis]MCO7591232.1 hypothetical protein [Pseudomonas chlororaphis]